MNLKLITIFTLLIIVVAVIVAVKFPREPVKKGDIEPLPYFPGERILPQIGNRGNFKEGYYYPIGD